MEWRDWRALAVCFLLWTPVPHKALSLPECLFIRVSINWGDLHSNLGLVFVRKKALGTLSAPCELFLAILGGRSLRMVKWKHDWSAWSSLKNSLGLGRGACACVWSSRSPKSLIDYFFAVLRRRWRLLRLWIWWMDGWCHSWGVDEG